MYGTRPSSGSSRFLASKRARAWALLAVTACVGACTGSGPPGTYITDGQPPPPVDAGGPPDAWARYCWFGEGAPTAGSEVMMGSGIEAFTEIVDEQELMLQHGIQGGAHLEMHARMRGMNPGDPDDERAPAPQTLYTITGEDGMVYTAFECAFPMPYRDLGDGWFEMKYGAVTIIRDDLIFAIVDKRVKIRMRVHDVDGHFAETERWVTIVDPPPAADAGVAGP